MIPAAVTDATPATPASIANVTAADRARGALWGQFVGDALAMPVHWYYDTAALRRDYGEVTGYVTPKHPHPDSIFWRSRYVPASARGDILHDKARFWSADEGAGVHYHGFLAPGENTLNFQLAAQLLESLAARGGRYDHGDYTRRYLDFLLTPGRHQDTYVEECHRGFFTRFAQGQPPDACAVEDIHIGGLASVAGIAVAYRDDPAEARRRAVEHVTLTHAGRLMREATTAYVELLVNVLSGADVVAEIRRLTTDEKNSPAWLCARPLERWLKLPDEKVVGDRLSTACYLEDSLPAVLYLAWKYAGDFERALVVNTRLGGDNCHRGGVLGALLGAAVGEAGIPPAWRDGLHDATRLRELIRQVAG